MLRGVSTALALVCTLAMACSDGSVRRGDDTPPRYRRPPDAPADADLLGLVPDGAHLLVTVDLRRMRRFYAARPWSQAAADAGRGLSSRLPGDRGAALLAQADVLVLALWLDEGEAGKLLLLARGADRGRGALGAWMRRSLDRSKRPPTWEPYRRVPLAKDGQSAVALPTKRTVISGPTPQVRHALDLYRAVPGYASAREDRVLMALWRRVTGRQAGRAPLGVAVARFPEGMRDRMGKRLGLKAPPVRGALRLSAATWITLRGFLDFPSRAAASVALKRLQGAVQAVGRSRVARRLGITALLSLLKVHPEGGRLHLQWFAPTKRVDPYLTRLVPLLRAVAPKPPARPAGKKRLR